MENEKTLRLQRIGLILIAITLVANIVLMGINGYLIFQFSQNLSNLSNLKFQSNLPNSTYIMSAIADDVILGKPTMYLSQNGTIIQTIHHGTLYATVKVVTPHYAALTIRFKNFSASESEYLNFERRNETEVLFADDRETHAYVLAPGNNAIGIQLPLKANVYLNPEKIPAKGESVQILLGHMLLEAESFDFEAESEVACILSARIFITLELPR